jgi:hypothetical protein
VLYVHPKVTIGSGGHIITCEGGPTLTVKTEEASPSESDHCYESTTLEHGLQCCPGYNKILFDGASPDSSSTIVAPQGVRAGRAAICNSISFLWFCKGKKRREKINSFVRGRRGERKLGLKFELEPVKLQFMIPSASCDFVRGRRGERKVISKWNRCCWSLFALFRLVRLH